MKNVAICGFLIFYAALGAVLRYHITFPSDPNWEGTRILFGVASIPYIMIGIGWGLHSLIYKDAKRSRIGQGVVVGLTAGFGGMTILILAFDAMKYFFGCRPI